MKDIVGRVWPYILGGIAVGAAIYGYVSEGAMAAIMGQKASLPALRVQGTSCPGPQFVPGGTGPLIFTLNFESLTLNFS